MLVRVLTLVLIASAGPALLAAQDSTLDRAFDLFWAARSPAEYDRAIAAIQAASSRFDDVLARLKAGRPYSNDVPRGRRLVTRANADGTEHDYVVHVPDEYDAAQPYPVRVYLHGGVMRPQRRDGQWWPNDDALARDDSLVVFPASWAGSIWWQDSQLENLAGILTELKRTYNIDETRLYLLGVSDGGTGAFYHAFKAPTPWAAFLSFNGHPAVLANPSSEVSRDLHVVNLRNKPWLVINGTLDRLYPAESVARFVRLFEAAGVSVDFRPQPGAGHNLQWWPREAPAIDRFIAAAPRRPFPDRLVWETEAIERVNRAHWVVITGLGSAEGESDLEDFNAIALEPSRTPLGISMISELPSPPGLKLFDVTPDSIIERAGLRVGDVLIKVNDRPTPTVEAFKTAIVGFGPGDRYPVKVDRDGEVLDLVLEYPAPSEPELRQVFPRRRPPGRVQLERSDNTITALTEGVTSYVLLVSSDQFDLSRPVTVVTNGRLSYEGLVTPSVDTLLRWAARDQDRTMLFGAELEIALPPRP